MLDVEPPDSVVRTWKDIVLHLAIITIGLFIALTLESLLEHIHHVHLVNEARANLASEIADNRKELSDQLETLDKSQQSLKNDLTTLVQLEKNPKAHGTLTYQFSGMTLEDTSWNTAQITGAVSYMTYPEVKQYAEIYSLQKQFIVTQQKSLDNIDLIGELNAFDTRTPTKEDLQRIDHQLRSVYSDNVLLLALAKRLKELYSQPLNHR